MSNIRRDIMSFRRQVEVRSEPRRTVDDALSICDHQVWLQNKELAYLPETSNCDNTLKDL